MGTELNPKGKGPGQKQFRTGKRSKNGCPEFTERVAAYVTPAQHKKLMVTGKFGLRGSALLRRLIDIL